MLRTFLGSSLYKHIALPEVDCQAIELLDGMKETSGDVVAFF